MPVRRKEIGPEPGPGDVGGDHEARAWRAWVWPAVHVLIDVALAVVAIAAMDSFAYPDLGILVRTDGLMAQGVWMVVLLRLLTEVCIGGVASKARPAGGRRAERARLAVSSLTIAVCVSVIQAGVPTMRAAWSEPGLAPVPSHGMAVVHARFGDPTQAGTISADAALDRARSAVPSASSVGYYGTIDLTQSMSRYSLVQICPFDCDARGGAERAADGTRLDPNAWVPWFPDPPLTPAASPDREPVGSTGGAVVTDVTTARQLYGLSAEAVATLEAGGIVVRRAPAGGLPQAGFVSQRVEVKGSGSPKVRIVHAEPAHRLPVTVEPALAGGYPPPGLDDGLGELPPWSYPDSIITPEGAKRIGAKYTMDRLVVVGGPDGIGAGEERRLRGDLTASGAMAIVVRRPPTEGALRLLPALAAVALLLHGLLAGRRRAVSSGSAAVAAALGVAPVAGLALLASAPWPQVAAAALAPLLVGAGAFAGTVWARRRA